MNTTEAYNLMAERIGLSPEMIPFLADLFIDQAVINPILPATAKKLGQILELKPGKKVLDLGCGKGGVSLPLVHIYKVKLTGVDLMPDLIREAWSRAEYSGLYEQCRFVLDDVQAFIQNAKSQWDAVILIGAGTIIWNDIESALEAARPLVSEGGHLVVGEPYRKDGGPADPERALPYKSEITAKLEKSGQVIDILDDGPDGWRVYGEPQKKVAAEMQNKNAGNAELSAFLDQWIGRLEWESENLGFAVWVIKPN